MNKALGILVVLVLMATFTTIANGQFVESGNLANLLYRTAFFGILGIGVSFVIVTGGIDLSMGSVVALTGCLLPILLTAHYEPLGTEQRVVRVDTDDKAVVLPQDSPPLYRDDRLFFHVTKHVNLKGSYTIAAPPADGGDAADSLRFEESPAKLTQPVPDETGRRTVLVVGEPKKLDEVPAEERYEVVRIEPAAKRVTLAAGGPILAPGERVTVFTEVDYTQERRYSVAEASQPAAAGTVVRVQDIPSDLQADTPVVIEKIRHMSVPLAILMVFSVCVAIGLGHGLLVTKLNLQPFVVTLCGLLFYRGLARKITGERTVGFGSLFSWRTFESSEAFYVPVPFLRWISGEAGETLLGTAWIGIRVRVVLLIVLAIAAIVIMNYSVFGRYLKALGRNVEAARLSGINTDRMIIAAYVFCSMLAGLAGILFVLEVNQAAPSGAGTFFELWAIAAAVLGGCSLRGGEVSVVGVIIGAAVMQVLYNTIRLLEWEQSNEFYILALAILAAVIFDELLRRYTARRRARHEAVLAEQGAAKK